MRYNLSPQQRLLAWVATGVVLVIATIATYLLILEPSLVKSRNDIQDALLTIHQNSQKSENDSTLSKQVATIQSQADQLKQNFFDHTKALTFVEYIESTAAKYNVTQDLQLDDPSQVPANPTTFAVTEKKISLALAGPQRNLLQFFATLESNPAYIITTNLSLEKSQDGSSHLTLNGVIPWQ